MAKKFEDEGYLLLLYINLSITKKFPTETLSETIDSCIKNLGEVEYDKQNDLKLLNTPVLYENAEVRVTS